MTGDAQPQMVPPQKEPKWQVQISFMDKGAASIDEKVFAFEVKEECVILIKHDRWDIKGIPHIQLRIFPLNGIRKATVTELERQAPPSPSPIISPHTQQPVKQVQPN